MLPMTQPVHRRDMIFTAAVQTNRTSPRQRKQPVSDEHLQQLKSPPFFGWQHSDCHSTLPSSMKSSPGKDAATQAPHSQSAQHKHVRGQTAHSSSSVQLVRQSSSPWSTAVEGRCVKSASDTTWKGKRAMPPTISPTNQPDDLRTSAQERPELPSARAHFPVAPRSRSTIGTAATISADSAGHMGAAQAGKHATGSSVSQKGSSTSLHELSMDVRSGDLEATSALRHTTPMAAARGPLSPWSQGDKELPVSLREAGMPLHAALADGGMDRATLSPFPRSTDSRPPHSASTQCSATFPTSQVSCFRQHDESAGIVSSNVSAELGAQHAMLALDGSEAVSGMAVAGLCPPQHIQESPADTHHQMRPFGAEALGPEAHDEPPDRGRGSRTHAVTFDSCSAQRKAAPPVQATVRGPAALEFEASHTMAAEAGAPVLASAEGMKTVLPSWHTSDAHFRKPNEGQSSFFGDEDSFSAGISINTRASAPSSDAQHPPGAAPPGQGVAAGGFGSGINLPAPPDNRVTAHHSTWGSVATCTASSDHITELVQRRAAGDEGGPRTTWANLDPGSNDAAAQKAAFVAQDQSEHAPAVQPAADQLDPGFSSAAKATWRAAWDMGLQADDSAAAAVGSFFDQAGWSEGHATAPYDADAAVSPHAGPDMRRQGAEQAEGAHGTAPELSPWTDESAFPAEADRAGIAQGQVGEGEPFWCEEWGCWVSACGQYYYDEAMGAWSAIYSTEVKHLESQGDEQWDLQPEGGVGEDPSGRGAVADFVDEPAAHMCTRADDAGGPGGRSFFDSFSASEHVLVAKEAPHAPQTVKWLHASSPNVPEPLVTGPLAPVLHGSGSCMGPAKAGVGFAEPAESSAWPASLPDSVAEHEAAGRAYFGGSSAAGDHTGGGGFSGGDEASFFNQAAKQNVGTHASHAARGMGAAYGAGDGRTLQVPPQTCSGSAVSPVHLLGYAPDAAGMHGHAYLPQRVRPFQYL